MSSSAYTTSVRSCKQRQCRGAGRRCPFHRASTQQLSTRRGIRLIARAVVDDDEELDEDVAKFLEQQDTSERGFDPRENKGEVIGAEEVDEEKAKALCRDVVRIVRLLNDKRDMPLREAKLVLQIDDPRNDDKRKLGIEDSRGVSRDEMAAALEEVAAGRVPADRIALRYLHSEMVNWPFLASDNAAEPLTDVEVPVAAPEGGGVTEEDQAPTKVPTSREGQAQPVMSRERTEKPAGMADNLPGWMGYGVLYGVTLVPVFILVTVVAILFFSSLK